MTFDRLTALRAHLDLAIVNLLVLAGASLVAGHAYGLFRNSLHRHPDWSATKITLEKGVMGAQEFAYNTQPLARNRLNLGAWWGFQEVTLTGSVELAGMEAKFRLEPEGYVHLLYDHRPDGFSGVRFSTRPDFPSLRYEASPSGEFLTVDSLVRAAPYAADEWHLARLVFDAAGVELSVNGEPEGRFDRRAGPQRIGFRGGMRNAWVDDVVLRFADGTSLEETFTNTGAATAAAVVAFGISVSGVLLVSLAAWRMFSADPRRLGMGLALGGVLAGALAGGVYVVQWVRGEDYPTVDYAMQQSEEYWVKYTRTEVLEDLRARYDAAPTAGNYRVLVLGSSQTWGAGARSEEETWVRRLERMLNADSRGLRFELLNAAVSGQLAADVLRFLQSDLLAFHPDAVVIALANNDLDPDALGTALDEIVGLLTDRAIPTVLILEPNSIERRLTDSPHGDLAVKHSVMRAVGAEHGAPVIDLHAHLATQREAGLLWWDFVHLTSFGHRLVAEKLRADLTRILPLGLDRSD